MANIDLSAVPQHSCEELSRTLLRAVNAFFREPGEEERFQAWLAEYQKRERMARTERSDKDSERENPTRRHVCFCITGGGIYGRS